MTERTERTRGIADENIDQEAYIIDLVKRAASYKDFSELHFAIDHLGYLRTVDRSGVDTNPQQKKEIIHVGCSIDGCKKTSKDLDACMLKIGDRWFCRDHHPKTSGGIKPVGYTIPLAQQEAIDAARIKALKETPKETQSLLNSRIVEVAQKGD